MEDTYEAIHRAVLTNHVDLVSIRLSKPVAGQKFNRAVQLTERLMRLSNNNNNNSSSSASLSFKVVCSSDLVEVAQQTRADGVHVKEAHLSRIPEIRQSFPYRLLIGTSSHSVKSALSSFATYRPDYYFVGTCFLTTSHPEKSVQELEGPTLPGFVRSALEERFPLSDCPKVLAIGGIDEYNCDQPIGYGSDGVAVIGTVMRADNPGKAVLELSSKMNTALRELSRKP
jgi:thiamine-phosphate diphosphorylase